jgi:hypothetical protein
MAGDRHEVRRIIAEVARALDRRLVVEVRELPGAARLQLVLTHGTHHTQTEVPVTAVLAATESWRGTSSACDSSAPPTPCSSSRCPTIAWRT